MQNISSFLVNMKDLLREGYDESPDEKTLLN